MKFSAAAVLAAVAGVSAGAANVSYTTEVVDVYTTYCPLATELTYGGKTYTITSATTLTITDCPCTVTKPVVTTSAVVCHNCPAGGYSNSTLVSVAPTTPAATATATGVAVATETATTVPTAGAGKVAALSGAGLAGIVGLAAFVL